MFSFTSFIIHLKSFDRKQKKKKKKKKDLVVSIKI